VAAAASGLECRPLSIRVSVFGTATGGPRTPWCAWLCAKQKKTAAAKTTNNKRTTRRRRRMDSSKY
jgi:hypothetical protein